MLQTLPFQKHVKKYDDWYEKHPEVYQSELSAIKAHLLTLPKDIKGIEVGVGTGRFSAPLGLKEGIEPVEAMSKYAVRRGVEIMQGTAEKLPYKDMQFDFVLFVTICHLDRVEVALAAEQERAQTPAQGHAETDLLLIRSDPPGA